MFFSEEKQKVQSLQDMESSTSSKNATVGSYKIWARLRSTETYLYK